MGTSKVVADKLGGRRAHAEDAPACGMPVDPLQDPMNVTPETCPVVESEPNESQGPAKDARAPATSLDDCRAERLARLKRQTAKAEHELVELEQVRNDYRPLLLQVLQHAKNLYQDSTKDRHLIVNALIDKLAIEVSKDESQDTDTNSSCTRNPRHSILLDWGLQNIAQLNRLYHVAPFLVR